MRTVRATEANRQFSSVLKQVSQGEEFLIVSRGKPVATLSPVKISRKTRLAARDILLKRLSDQKPSGSRNWTRDELYEPKS
jgi:prevent-host-death family protein